MNNYKLFIISEIVKEGLDFLIHKVEYMRNLALKKNSPKPIPSKILPTHLIKVIDDTVEELTKQSPQSEPEIQQNQPVVKPSEPASVNESVQPTIKRGQGKIYDPSAQTNSNQEKTSQDVHNKRLEKINSGWESYKKIHKNDVNKEKPYKFNVVLG